MNNMHHLHTKPAPSRAASFTDIKNALLAAEAKCEFLTLSQLKERVNCTKSLLEFLVGSTGDLVKIDEFVTLDERHLPTGCRR